jgi:nitrate reductase NapE component
LRDESFFLLDKGLFVEESNRWLSSDLSLSIVDFLNAEFRDKWGQLNHGYDRRLGPQMRLIHLDSFAGIRSDVFHWGTFVYRFITGEEPGDEEATEWQIMQLIRAGCFPIISNEFLGLRGIITKCWMQQYTDTGEVRQDLLRFLGRSGYVVVDDAIQDFHPENVPDFAMELG